MNSNEPLKELTVMQFCLPRHRILAGIFLSLLVHLSAHVQAMNAMPDHANAAHGDHNPAHGGLVLMYGDLHFEVVAREAGGLELHLSDAMRAELPALTVSDVTIEVERKGEGFEPIAMTVSKAGDHWQGPSRALDALEDTKVHLAFVAFGEALVYALPLAALRQVPEQPASSIADTQGSDAH